MRGPRELLRGYEPHLIITGLIVLFVVVFFFNRIFVVIEPGNLGVMFMPLFGGTVLDHPYGEGLHMMFPWNRMYSYNMRVQETTRTLTALTKDGLSVKLDLSIRYHPDSAMVGLLHAAVGPDYVDSIVVPEVMAVVRANVALQTAEQLVTGQEAPQTEVPPTTTTATTTAATTTAPPTPPTQPVVQTTQAGAAIAPAAVPTTAPNPESKPASNKTLAEIVESSGEKVSRKYVVVDAVVLMRTTLPDRVQRAIEEKIEQKQFAETQRFRLLAAEQETRIKAQEAASNDALKDSITPNLLAWKGIEATKELAASPNAKMIFVGNTNGLPILLGPEKTP